MSAFAEIRRRSDARLRGYIGGQVLGLMALDGIQEISINPDGNIFASIAGRGHMEHVGHLPSSRVEAFICAAAHHLGKVIDTRKDCSLAGELPSGPPWRGARLQCTLPPVSSAATLTLRMHARLVFSLADYLNRGILTQRQHTVLVEAIRCNQDILVVAGTEAGKTTFLNAIINEIAEFAPWTRMLIIEDRRELQSRLANTKQLKTSGVLDQVALVKQALSERPDRIVLGEVRDHAAAMVIRAINTGHEGSAATIHGGSPELGLRMLESYIAQGTIPVSRFEIAQAIKLIVFMEKDRDHPAGRRVKSVMRVNPRLSPEGDYVLTEV